MHANALLTIGHSTLPIETFLEILARNEVTAVADVRSRPASRHNPHFNKDSLSRSLHAHGLKYVFLGRELGARSEDPDCYVDGKVQYDRLAQTELFQAGIQRLINGAGMETVAILCAESEPLSCHRTLLVARAVVQRGLTVEHVLRNGKREPHRDSMHRLMYQHGLAEADLLHSPDALMLEAINRQASRIAYIDENFQDKGRASS